MAAVEDGKLTFVVYQVSTDNGKIVGCPLCKSLLLNNQKIFERDER